MAIITKHELDVTEQGQVTRMIREAVATGKGIPWDGHDDNGVWKPGLVDFTPMLSPTGYFPQDCRNGFDDNQVHALDCPEFARQVALSLDALASCAKVPSGTHHIGESSWGIAEDITCKTGQSVCTGAVILAALAAGFTLSTDARLGDDLFVEGVSFESLHCAISCLKREAAHV